MKRAPSCRRLRRCITAAAITLVVGCSLQVGPGGITGSIILGGTAFTITLNEAGLFLARADAIVRNIADAAPFADTAADEPASGYLRLRDSSIIVEAPDTTTKAVNQQDTVISGTATLRVLLDAGGAAAPCDTGEDLGEFEITVEDCIVTGVSPELLLSLAAVDFFKKNSVALCLEMRTDFDATIRISGLDVIFGPSRAGSGGSQQVTFALHNASGENIHLLMPGEEFREDLNRVTPGSTRTVGPTTANINDLFTIRAGRQQQVFASATCPALRSNNTTYRVMWQGFSLTCEAELPPVESEACCMPPIVGYELEAFDNLFYQICVDINGLTSPRTRADCLFFGGVPQGPGTTCAGLTCAAPFMGCCIARPGLQTYCNELIAADCQRLGHTSQSANCDLFPCGGRPNENLVACCNEGECMEVETEPCTSMGGVPHGPGSVCSDTPCLPGACCIAGACSRLFQGECTAQGGVYHGDGVSCSTGVCTPAACCWDNGCANADLPSCMELSGGMYLGVSLDCTQESVDCAEGACCWTGGCTESSRGDCAQLPGGVFQGWQSLCADAPCASGACCAGNSCSVTQRSACIDDGVLMQTFMGADTACSDALCQFGACCVNGSCASTTQAFCVSPFSGGPGTFEGVGTACADVTCP